jgi:carbamoyltransferase
MLVLGFSDFERASTVALLHGQQPIAAIEEEKLSRISAHNGLPRLGIDYCLRQAGVRPQDIGAVALTGRPRRAWFREERLRLDVLTTRPDGHAKVWSAGPLVRRVRRVKELRQLFGASVPFLGFEHHLCHASSAFFASPFDRALVLTLDGSGDMWSGLVSLGEGTNLKQLQPLRFPNSLGWLYSRVTELLGFTPGADEHKTQWLSTTGQPQFLSTFRALFQTDDRGLPMLDRRFLGRPVGDAWRLSPRFGSLLELSQGRLPSRPLAAAVARSMQAYLEESVVEIAERYRISTGTKYLCVAGGVFLNVLLVRALEKHTGFDRVFVQPAADNSGTSLGAAWLASARSQVAVHRRTLEHLHLGPAFDAASIKAVVDNCKLIYNYHDTDHDLFENTVRLLNTNRMVAWYQDRMEFGLRALGNRTILASPFAPYVTDNLNRYLKRRDDYHPFVLSVPADRAAALFEYSENCRFAASVGELRAGYRELEPFAFDGRTVRLHLVHKEVNPRFYALLERFGRTAPAPVLVNTSFNLFGEPLVYDPRAAVRSFYCSGIDALVMDRFLIEK